jgi:hypothetical protein
LQSPKKIVPEPFQPRRQSSSPKHSRFIDQAVHVAIARTGAAVFQFGKHGFDALRKFSLPVRFQVCRLELPK